MNFISRNIFLLFTLCILSSNARRLSARKTVAADGGVLTDEDKQKLVDIHNTHRGDTALGNTGSQPPATNMVKLIWDEDIAVGAKEHADLCGFEHADTGFGENLYAAASSVDSVDNIEKLVSGVTDWYNEEVDYTYDTGSCGAVCGHYTQVVWAESTKVGCGYAECTDIFPSSFPFQVYLVCRYDPPGNFVGEKPYEEASSASEAASNCPSGYVADTATGLCELPTEDGSEDETDNDTDSETDDNTDDALASLASSLEALLSVITALCAL